MSGFIILTIIGPFFLTEIKLFDIFFLFLVCCLGTGGHFLMIKAFKYSEASLLQPFVYLHLVFVSFIGIYVFEEKIDFHLILGSLIVILAGLYTFWRERIV